MALLHPKTLTNRMLAALTAAVVLALALTGLILTGIVFAATGTITTVAGSDNIGDGGLATAATLDTPYAVAVSASGDVYIGELQGNRVRRVDGVTGEITTVAGIGVFGSQGDGGLATAAHVGNPFGLALDAPGNLFISSSNRVRRVDEETGIITTVAGGGSDVPGDGGPAASASIFPIGLWIDASGDLYIADSTNDRIRKVEGVAAAEPTPVPTATPTPVPTATPIPSPTPTPTPMPTPTPVPSSTH